MPDLALRGGTLRSAAAFRERVLDPVNVLTLARKEMRESLRNRWFILYSIAFALLALALSFLSLVGTGTYGFAGFGRTAASLINLVILIIPLMALTAGAATLAGERDRGMLGYLLAQPVTRLEVLLGKYIGLGLAISASLAFGFGISAIVIAARGGVTDVGGFVRLVVLSMLLGLAMLSVGMLISAMVRRGTVANGTAIFVWLSLVFLGDLGLMGSTIVFRLQVTDLFRLCLVNPLQVFRMASLESISASLDVLGPTGFYATQTFGDSLGLIFGSVLAAWIVLPLVAAYVMFAWRGAA